jgi:hypothetical protein
LSNLPRSFCVSAFFWYNGALHFGEIESRSCFKGVPLV